MSKPYYSLVTLILDNDDVTYTAHRATWKAYMNNDPTILCLFLRFDSEKEWLDISTNTLYCKGTESLIPGVLEKTLHGFAYVLKHYSCDYILRTNISSFFVFQRFKVNVLPMLPRFACYAGVQGFDGFPFVSGAGMVISPDVAQLLVQNIDKINFGQIDDLAIAAFLNKLHFSILPLRRFDFVYDRSTHDDEVKLAQANAQNTYHFRIKNDLDRATFDSHYLRLLLKAYYGVEVE